MRISKGFSNQISKVNTTFWPEKAELYIYEEIFVKRQVKFEYGLCVFHRNGMTFHWNLINRIKAVIFGTKSKNRLYEPKKGELATVT